MTSTVIITLCVLLLVSYLFALTSGKTKIPSVLLLLITGFGIKQAAVFFEIQLPDFNPVLPIIATIGLVLIVLEGSLELKLDRSKIGLITKSFFGALFPILIISGTIAYGFQYFGGFDFRNCLINAIPFAIISSAIAIPSAVNLPAAQKEFVIYESSLSDILGVLIFNFVMYNEVYNGTTFGNFGLQIGLILVISLIATIGLSMLLARINHHVKFVPIILLVILLYTELKVYHLPGLIFILLFGLFVGHLDKLKHLSLIGKFISYEPAKEVELFTVLTIEGTFLIRSLFFLVFGYLLDSSELLDSSSMIWAVAIVGLFILVRALQLAVSRIPITPLLFVAPRGLITILLFLYITPENSIIIANKSLIIQVIILSVLVMTFGMMFTSNEDDGEEHDQLIDPHMKAAGLNSVEEPKQNSDE